ncbi:GNAT family N-acetyltransferase [Flaviflexus salsibiostraticola]|uniref:GNAT family N-acetyltransferase n=1 Tax=Flaviflexus salsibiostraticola TaxID=1282737 RepID=A0A3S8Z5W5_9ACTO|nr:GNAT family N-acetyltransferase [Flaviflexus salsibiostraticola]AZN28865.1 GNAT family N-acetyltransferase [Flaviflexus salsibiostraticola]
MRRLGPADAEAFAALDRDIFGPDAWPEGIIADQLAHERIVALGIDGEHGLDAAGMLGLGIEAELLTVSVRPERRRQGLAGAIVRGLLDLAEGAESCFLEVRAADEGAQRLYRELGFYEVGRRHRYYRDDDAVVMRKDLPTVD